MNPNLTSDPQHASLWRRTWITTKFVGAVVACSLIVILMAASTEGTVTPVAQANGTATPIATINVLGTPIPTVQPSPSIPNDAFVPGRLFYVQQGVIYMVQGYDDPIAIASVSDGQAGQPSVSPDGRKLVFTAEYKNYSDLMVVTIATRKVEQFLRDAPTVRLNPETGKTAATPAWSDDGKTIYFSWSYPGSPSSLNNLLTYETDLSITKCPVAGPCNTSTATRITPSTCSNNDCEPAFQSGGDSSPAPRLGDPNYLVFSRWQYLMARNGQYQSLSSLIAFNLSDSSETTLTNPLDNVSQPVWSSDGHNLAFVRPTADLLSTSIWVMGFHAPGLLADYSTARQLVAGAPFAADPVFSPDDRYIAYVAKHGSDADWHLYIAPVYFGPHAHIGTPQEVQRAGVIAGDRLAWAPAR